MPRILAAAEWQLKKLIDWHLRYIWSTWSICDCNWWTCLIGFWWKYGFTAIWVLTPKVPFQIVDVFTVPKFVALKCSILRRVFTFGFYPSLHWPKRFKFFIHNALDLTESKCGVLWLKRNYLWFTFPTIHKPQNYEFPPQFWQMVNLVCLIPFAGFANGRLGNLTRLDNFGTLRTCLLLERHASPSARAPCSPSCWCLFNFHKKGSRYCFTAQYSNTLYASPLRAMFSACSQLCLQPAAFCQAPQLLSPCKGLTQ